jgi:hypothetical protein
MGNFHRYEKELELYIEIDIEGHCTEGAKPQLKGPPESYDPGYAGEVEELKVYATRKGKDRIDITDMLAAINPEILESLKDDLMESYLDYNRFEED